MKSLFLSLSRPLLRVRSSPYNGIHFFLSLLRNKLNLSLISICCALLQRSRVFVCTTYEPQYSTLCFEYYDRLFCMAAAFHSSCHCLVTTRLTAIAAGYTHTRIYIHRYMYILIMKFNVFTAMRAHEPHTHTILILGYTFNE